jgi:hypothetical protein
VKGASTRGPRPSAAEAGRADGPTPPATAGGGPFSEASREARKLAAAILEVLAGTTAPTEAARAVGVSLARYYQLELRAMAGLVAACEDRRRRGRTDAPGGELTALRREVVLLRRECARQQALARAARRAIGLTPAAAPPPPPDAAPKRRGRRPTARGLRMAALLQQGSEPTEDAPPSTGAEETPPEAASSEP